MAEGKHIREGILIRVDWMAAAIAGALVLSLRGLLAGLYGLPEELLFALGLVNLAYACASFTLAMLGHGERVPFFRVMATANIGWALVCVVLAIVWFGRATIFGMGQLVGEALFVGGLGVLEWRTITRSRSRAA